MPRLFDTAQIGSIEIFCKIAELNSFSAAASMLGITPAAVSRSLSRLEKRLGVKLFVRTTRKISLTDAGATYFNECQQALNQLSGAASMISGSQLKPSGLLRISVPTTYAHYRLLPLMPKFQQLHPDISLEIDVSNRNINFVEDGYDVAIRLGELADSNLIARKLEDAAISIFGSPEYLARCGNPETIESLTKHQCIQFLVPSTGRALKWLFKKDKQNIEYEFSSKVQFSQDVLGSVTMARHGGGLLQTFCFIAEQYPKQLIEVLATFSGRSRPFYLLYPQNRYLPLRVSALITFLQNEINPLSK